jgi:ribose transport system permease protein
MGTPPSTARGATPTLQVRAAAVSRDLAQRLVESRVVPLVAVIVLASVVVGSVTPNFLTTSNFQSVLIGDVSAGIAVVGQTMLLVCGGLDLSVGGVLALCGTVAAWLATHGVPGAPAMLLAVGAGAMIGAVNGLVVASLSVNPLIATLGTGSVTTGIALVMTQGFNISGLPSVITNLGNAGPLGLPWVVWIALAIVLVADLALRWTRLFRQLYFVGGNERAAYLSGIRVRRLRVLAYSLSGALAACAGVLLAARLDTAVPTAGTDLPLTSIAAAVIGGASLSGGEGTIIGAALGVLFLSLITNVLTVLGVSIYWQTVATGTVLVLVVAFDMLVRGRASLFTSRLRKGVIHD